MFPRGLVMAENTEGEAAGGEINRWMRRWRKDKTNWMHLKEEKKRHIGIMIDK